MTVALHPHLRPRIPIHLLPIRFAPIPAASGWPCARIPVPSLFPRRRRRALLPSPPPPLPPPLSFPLAASIRAMPSDSRHIDFVVVVPFPLMFISCHFLSLSVFSVFFFFLFFFFSFSLFSFCFFFFVFLFFFLFASFLRCHSSAPSSLSCLCSRSRPVPISPPTPTQAGAALLSSRRLYILSRHCLFFL